MPFCKWIITTSKCPSSGSSDDVKQRYTDLNAVTDYASDVANGRMVNAIRQLSQIAQIADDIFTSLEEDCKIVFYRTEKIGIKIKRCQEIVDKLDAKTVPVPQGTLSSEQVTTVSYVSCHAKDTYLLSPTSRPPALDRLYSSADGPSPPVCIPPSKVAKAADGRPESASSITHIYCQPFGLENYCSSLSSEDTLSEKPMSSGLEIPSTVVPIDVSGQPFSRMASFRRSLIHVDFLIRRKKKKDKRRNTVSEVDTKELKEVLQKVAIENQLPNVPSSSNNPLNAPVDHNHFINTQDSITKSPDINNSLSEEKNNNFIKKVSNKSPQNSAILNTSNGFVQDSDNLLKLKQNSEITSNGSFINRKKKPRSNLPISTSSAAMTVAVKMRQTHNGIRHEDGQSSSGNWSCSSERTSSDSDQQRQAHVGYRNGCRSPLSNSDDSLLTDNSMTGNRQCKLTSRFSTSERCQRNFDEIINKEDVEFSSDASSDCRKNSLDGDGTSTTASVDTDAIFISSGESDDELSDLSFFQETFGSSTSLSTISNGSLNSLLSRTGTEMTSSTGTLTSICQEPLPTPPPPPPKEVVITPLKGDSPTLPCNNVSKTQKGNSKQKLPKSPIKMLSKTCKSPPKDLHKSEQGTSKNIFVNLVNKKTQQKNNSDERNVKPKEIVRSKKMAKIETPLEFDMYGNQSPRKTKQVPIFLKENISPVIEKSPRHQLQSFCPNDGSSTKLETDNCVRSSKSTMMRQVNGEINHQTTKLTVPHSTSEYNTDFQSSDTLSDASEKTINEEIAVPLKYGHQITVTPVRRHASIENYSNDVCRRSYIHIPKYGLSTKSEPICDMTNVISPNTTNGVNNSIKGGSTISSGFSTFNAGKRPQRPVTLLPTHTTKPAARVVLDPEGRVVYSTNSLDRRRYNAPADIIHSDKQMNFHPNQLAFAEVHQNPYQASYSAQHNSARSPTNKVLTNGTSVSPNTGQSHYSDSHSQYYINEKCYTPSPVTEFYPSHKILPSREDGVKVVYPAEIKQSDTGNVTDINGKYHFTPVNSSNLSPPDPNISGLPQSTSMLTQQNVNLHSQRLSTPTTEKSLRSSSSECSYLLSSPPSLYINDSKALNGDLQTLKQSSMSTEDLFAVIHNCKKRLNIKTDSDHSLASSSRSSSPSYVRQSNSKGCLAETGFLSPRNSYAQYDSSRDRRSWADFRSPPGSNSERKSFASDRLGPTKPTSMHDFKMLLLQARTSNQATNDRKSAVELLKVPVSKNNTLGINSSPLNLSPRNSISFTTQNSPTSEAYLYSGHSTVPFKRGNRARSSLQPRYMMYPPIFEDCSEEMENSRETNVDDRNRSKQVKNDGNYNRCASKNVGASSMWV